MADGDQSKAQYLFGVVLSRACEPKVEAILQQFRTRNEYLGLCGVREVLQSELSS